MLQAENSQSELPRSRGPESATGGRPSPESRFDPITGAWTIFAPARDDRPEEYVAAGEKINHQLRCPFCCGNEDLTKDPTWVGQIRDGVSVVDADPQTGEQPTTDHWAVRVVPNLYPAVGSMTAPEAVPLIPTKMNNGLFERESIRGGHDVFIESRRHVSSISELDLTEIQLTFAAYRDRVRYWKTVPNIAYISVFKNVGEKGGASLRHAHSQLIATDTIPPAIRQSMARVARHRATTGCCLQCDLIRAESKAGQRVVWKDQSLIAFCPFASRLPMQLRITTQEHQSDFEQLDDKTIDSVSRLLQRAVLWLERLRPGTAYNFCLATRPPGIQDLADAFHWSIDLFPRMTQIAGFEWSSGAMINPVLPESAAANFRRCAQAENPRQR